MVTRPLCVISPETGCLNLLVFVMNLLSKQQSENQWLYLQGLCMSPFTFIKKVESLSRELIFTSPGIRQSVKDFSKVFQS